MVFPVVMYGCESWTIKKAEHWRCFWTVVLKTLESPLDCKEIHPVNPEGNQSWIFIGRTDAEAEAPMATWRKELTHLKRPWCWERLKTGGEWDDRGWDGGVASPTWWTWVWVSSGSWWWTGKPGVLQSMGMERVSTTVLNSYYLTIAFLFVENMLQRVSFAFLKATFYIFLKLSSYWSFSLLSPGVLSGPVKASPIGLPDVLWVIIPNETHLGHHWRWLLFPLFLRPVTQTSHTPDFCTWLPDLSDLSGPLQQLWSFILVHWLI